MESVHEHSAEKRPLRHGVVLQVGARAHSDTIHILVLTTRRRGQRGGKERKAVEGKVKTKSEREAAEEKSRIKNERKGVEEMNKKRRRKGSGRVDQAQEKERKAVG